MWFKIAEDRSCWKSQASFCGKGVALRSCISLWVWTKSSGSMKKPSWCVCLLLCSMQPYRRYNYVWQKFINQGSGRGNKINEPRLIFPKIQPTAELSFSTLSLPFPVLLSHHLFIVLSVYLIFLVHLDPLSTDSPLAPTLSHCVSVSSPQASVALISWAGSILSLCSKKSQQSALWIDCWHRSTQLSLWAGWTGSLWYMVSQWGIWLKCFYQSCLFCLRCRHSESKPETWVLLPPSCSTNKHNYALLCGCNPFWLSVLFLWPDIWDSGWPLCPWSLWRKEIETEDKSRTSLLSQMSENLLKLEYNSLKTGTYLWSRIKGPHSKEVWSAWLTHRDSCSAAFSEGFLVALGNLLMT